MKATGEKRDNRTSIAMYRRRSSQFPRRLVDYSKVPFWVGEIRIRIEAVYPLRRSMSV